jgi:host factor-I protein
MEEARYLRRLSQTRKPVSIKLRDGNIVTGWIEYFDRSFIRLTREPLPNLFIYKWDILYIAEQPERRLHTSVAEAKLEAPAPGNEPPSEGEGFGPHPRPQAPGRDPQSEENGSSECAPGPSRRRSLTSAADARPTRTRARQEPSGS